MGKEQTQLAKLEPTYSQRFTNMVVREFSRELGKLQMTPYQERLAQHLFIGVDISLKKLEADRLKKDVKKLPIVWTNVNMEKLAIDAVHRVELGLDALIPNHIHTIPYLNGKTGKYDLSLDIGYVGKDYYKRKMAIIPPKDIIYRLVHKNDTFEPLMKNLENKCESYRFVVPQPFDRGAVVGGFGYIIYEDATLNRLIIVSKASFDKSQKKAQSDAFWGPYTEEMQMVALVRRVTAKLNIDPEKVNASFMKVEIDEAVAGAEREIDENANQDIIDVEPGPEEEQKPQGSESTWNPCTSEIQQRYGADKAEILKEICAAREINIGGLTAKEAHEKLLEVVAKGDHTQGPKEKVEGKGEKEELPKKEGAENEGNQYVYCPTSHRPTAIAVCETDKCGKFLTCDTVQDKIAKLMEAERVAAAEAEEGPGGPGPEDPGPEPRPAF